MRASIVFLNFYLLLVCRIAWVPSLGEEVLQAHQRPTSTEGSALESLRWKPSTLQKYVCPLLLHASLMSHRIPTFYATILVLSNVDCV